MKKLVSLLLVFVMLLGVLCSCNDTNKNTNIPSDDTNTPSDEENTPNDEANMPSDEENKAGSTMDKEDSEQSSEYPYCVKDSKYFSIECIGIGKYKYVIYNKDGNAVLTKETNRPLDVYMMTDNIVSISIGMGTGISLKTYYNVETDTFSEEYSYVITTSDELIVYLDGDLDDRVLVAKSIFDNDFYLEFCDLGIESDVMPVCSAGIVGANLHFSYSSQDNTQKTVILNLFETQYDHFVDYTSITELVNVLEYYIYHFGETLDYHSVLGVVDEQHVEWFDKLFGSILSFSVPNVYGQVYSIGFAVKDINLDGVFELIILNSNYDLIAVFTTVDSKPVLLDNYYLNDEGCIDHNGYIIRETNKMDYSTFSVKKISNDGASLDLIAAFGVDCDNWKNGLGAEKYYKIVDGEKIPLSEEEYVLLGSEYPFFASNNFTSMVARVEYTNMQYKVLQAAAKQALLGVINGEAKVFDKQSGTECFLSELKIPSGNITLAQAENLSYAMTDINGDRANELIIDYGDGILILRYLDGRVYASYGENLNITTEFHPFELPFTHKISLTQAWSIANEYLDNIDGETTGAAGSTLTYRVALTNNPIDDVRYYHFILHYEQRRNEAPSYSFPTSISTPLREVIVDAITGECKSYEPPVYVGEDYGK